MGARDVGAQVKVTQVTHLVAITANGRPIETVNKVDEVLSVIPVGRLLEYVVKNVPTEAILTAVGKNLAVLEAGNKTIQK